VTDAATTEGIRGDSTLTGVLGVGASSGVVGVGGSVGGLFSGSSVALSLDPQTTAGPAASGFKGDLLVDSNGVPWLCIADGTPGKWIRVGGPQILANPVRAYDSRAGQPPFANPTKGPLADGGGSNVGAPRNIDLRAYAPLGIPAGANAVFVNLTVVNTTGSGWLAAWPGPASNPYPGTSNINWTTSGATIANFAVLGLGADGTVNLAAARPTDVIVDVGGYNI
jgi:hypothetical protein